MLKEKIEQLVVGNEPLFPIEKAYAVKQGLIDENVDIHYKGWGYTVIERCLKETEEVIKEEHGTFMNEPVSYFKRNIDEFVYIESTAFEIIKVDGMALETDDVFQTYTVLFGLKVQKKWGPFLKDYLAANVGSKTYSAMFSDTDGLWDVNIPLNHLEGFESEMPITDAVDLAYRFIFNLLEAIEAAN
ncbi:branched-chain amino acid aminotransferase [Sporosarcina thermotolerans]|uniref:Branched-chain amino acid aminotransferase n=1 Tax=Sporosarcina thermotolerans TaxID=633404 RepID=A0AAW9A8M4_9BACL|nr:branched-chain amino acid aminotransferase [Sporosarcina thermotolerans]MDW0116001.1 branched-chain amino acid aminotransferase [Sporosarcina thermotolerans]WHT49813.1 branched-chain amino acid aminotransferase [Sporosarcina thermotolerans]